jgi:hypothetical protein
VGDRRRSTNWSIRILSRLRHKSNFVISSFVTGVTKFQRAKKMVDALIERERDLRRLVEQDLGLRSIAAGRLSLEVPFPP